MGCERVTKQASAELNETQLHRWFDSQCEEMAKESGTDRYCGNWNSNSGLTITDKTFLNRAAAEAYFDKELEKCGEVLAVRVGDFKSAWPASKEQKAISAKLAVLEKEASELEYRILERTKKQKSKTKKCGHCESGINVHRLSLPQLSELENASDRFTGEYAFRRGGRVLFVNIAGLTDCPVCQHNLLKTDTDVKNEESLKKRLSEQRAKVRESQTAHAQAQQGKPRPYWLVAADCGD